MFDSECVNFSSQ